MKHGNESTARGTELTQQVLILCLPKHENLQAVQCEHPPAQSLCLDTDTGNEASGVWFG